MRPWQLGCRTSHEALHKEKGSGHFLHTKQNFDDSFLSIGSWAKWPAMEAVVDIPFHSRHAVRTARRFLRMKKRQFSHNLHARKQANTMLARQQAMQGQLGGLGMMQVRKEPYMELCLE